jgi:hypothetical protein
MQTNLGGIRYVKRASGADYRSGTDIINSYKISPEEATLTTMMAVATGMAGVRAYHWDSRVNKSGRLSTGLAANNPLENHADPWASNTSIWNATALAYNLIRGLEKFIVQPNMNSPYLGPMVLTGAKDAGSFGKLLMAINLSDISRAVTIPFTGFRYGIRKYLLTSRHLAVSSIADAGQDTVTVPAGATILYIFEPVPTALKSLTLGIVLPAGATKAALRTGYYPSSLSHGESAHACAGNSCSAVYDPWLASNFYWAQWIYTNDNNVVVARSDRHVWKLN